MYVCMYVMCVCMREFVCVYVFCCFACMYVCVRVRNYACMHVIYGWMDGCLYDVCMYVWMDGWMGGWMYACMRAM